MNSIEFGERKIDYDLKRSKRKTLGMEINAKGQLIVTAPDYIPLDKVEEVLQKRKNWIIEKMEEKSSNLQIQPKRKYVSGESIYVFGKQYYLKIVKSNDFYVEKDIDRLTFYMIDTSKAENVVTDWLDAEFRSLVAVKAAECLDRFRDAYSIPVVPTFLIRKMSKRWGSCTNEGTIILNPKLVASSVESIEYVIYHELSHLLHYDHGEEFYRTLRGVCVNYEMIKERLDRETILFDLK